ncbi:lanthionine synthetase LanC family protein [Effusibacillus consociatus]|uniref:Lanthionine synthetase LanC family protein n=1 Tax=Effusibacillus consociatus TaxID=1117041 RepID=A0ABV9Q3U8_9BACL
MTGSYKALNIGKKCGEHLLASAKQLDVGLGWAFEEGGFEPIAGLSHGAAGIAWALIELSSVTGDARFLEAALKSIDFERTLFNPVEGNWTDLRFQEKRAELGLGTPVQWCHGAAGITLGRLMVSKYYRDQNIEEEIRVGLDTTIREGFGGSHCLCHGDFGNLEVLLIAAKVLKDQKLKDKAYEYGTNTLFEARSKGWFCGIPQEEETPSLMLGLSGIGFGLLRLSNPERVPPVVVLGAPQLKEERVLRLWI